MNTGLSEHTIHKLDSQAEFTKCFTSEKIFGISKTPPEIRGSGALSTKSCKKPQN
jgi:hypothetical protein